MALAYYTTRNLTTALALQRQPNPKNTALSSSDKWTQILPPCDLLAMVRYDQFPRFMIIHHFRQTDGGTELVITTRTCDMITAIPDNLNSDAQFKLNTTIYRVWGQALHQNSEALFLFGLTNALPELRMSFRCTVHSPGYVNLLL